MDAMRKLFVVLGFLLVVGFFGVEMARENKITEREDRPNKAIGKAFIEEHKAAGTILGDIAKGNKKSQADPSDKQKQAEEAEARRSKPNGGTFQPFEKLVVDLTGCHEKKATPFKPAFGKPEKEKLSKGFYAVTFEGSTDYFFYGSNGGYLRTFWPDGAMSNPGNQGWILNSDVSLLPIPDAPYATVLMKIGTGKFQAIGNGKRFSLSSDQTVSFNVNIFLAEEYYSKSDWHITKYLWQCDSPKQTESTAKPIYMRVKAPNEVNVRTGPSAEYGVVKKIVNGDFVPVHRTENGWSNIGDGWVNSKFLYESEDD